MKHLKIYESFEKVLIIDLLALCEYTGSMSSAVKKLKELSSISSSYTITRGDYNFGTYFDYYKIMSHNSITGKDEDAIDLKGEAFSYPYLLNNPNKSIIFTFYDIEVNDENLITISTQYKYNL